MAKGANVTLEPWDLVVVEEASPEGHREAP
jgi:hypothetical protein